MLYPIVNPLGFIHNTIKISAPSGYELPRISKSRHLLFIFELDQRWNAHQHGGRSSWLLLSQRSADFKYSPCPPVRDWGIHLSSLVSKTCVYIWGLIHPSFIKIIFIWPALITAWIELQMSDCSQMKDTL